ncbi:MAG TPA: flagellar basal body-associated FliL family protein [Gemmatimonadaceae bacterium]
MAEEKPPETEATAEPAKKGGIARLLPLIGGVVGGLALGATVGFALLGPKLSHKSAPTASKTADSTKATMKDSAEVKKGDAAPSIYQLDNLVMNPAGSGGTHFLLMSVALQVKDAGSLETLKGRDAELRDAILRLFSNKNIDQITDISARDRFGSELMVVLAKMFGDGTVTKIYFPQFVIQ